MFELTISRKEWLRGEGSMFSFLLREEDKKKCCIGIYLSALGVKDSILCNTKNAKDIDTSTVKIPNWLRQSLPSNYFGDLTDVIKAYEINDAKRLNEEERENKLTEIFAKHNVNVTFVD